MLRIPDLAAGESCCLGDETEQGELPMVTLAQASKEDASKEDASCLHFMPTRAHSHIYTNCATVTLQQASQPLTAES